MRRPRFNFVNLDLSCFATTRKESRRARSVFVCQPPSTFFFRLFAGWAVEAVDGSLRQDPLAVLPPEVIEAVLLNLNPLDLLACRLVGPGWQRGWWWWWWVCMFAPACVCESRQGRRTVGNVALRPTDQHRSPLFYLPSFALPTQPTQSRYHVRGRRRRLTAPCGIGRWRLNNSSARSK